MEAKKVISIINVVNYEISIVRNVIEMYFGFSARVMQVSCSLQKPWLRKSELKILKIYIKILMQPAQIHKRYPCNEGFRIHREIYFQNYYRCHMYI